MKKTLKIGKGRLRNRNVTVNGARVWKRKRSKKRAPIFYVTFKQMDGKRVSRSTGQRRRNIAVDAAQIIRKEIQPLLFPTVQETQAVLL